MAHEIETMFYTREKPWHGLGTMVADAPTSADALSLAGLDWKVESQPIFTYEGAEIPNYKANVRDSDKSVLGIVSNRYTIVQNTEAFAFTDSLINDEVHYETAGSLSNGRKIWLLAKLPPTKIIGDEVEPYLCFTNTHDGSGAVRACMTPIRVVCNNTLNFALKTAKRAWSTKHVGDIQAKLTEARHTLELAGEYMDELDKYADVMTNKDVSIDKVREILNELFPVKETDSDRVKATSNKIKEEYMICYFMPDLEKFRGTAWGALNAMVDMTNHSAPQRQTKNYAENNWERIINGHYLVDTMATKLAHV